MLLSLCFVLTPSNWNFCGRESRNPPNQPYYTIQHIIILSTPIRRRNKRILLELLPCLAVMLQPSTYASWITHQNTQKPSLIVHRRCRSSSRVAAAVTAAAAPGAEAAAQQESHAAVQQLVSARQLDPDPCLVAQEAHLALSYLASQPDALPAQLNAVQLAGHALLLTDLMATGSTFRTLQMIKRHPALLRLPPEEVSSPPAY